jgi:Tfp pilus assembly protein PilW
MRKKGFTIFELMVSMTIFITFSTVVIGAFVSMTRLKSLSGTMRESQQKIRVSMEMISRLARQTDEIILPTANEARMYFDDNGTRTASKFVIDNTNRTIYYYECSQISANYCTQWNNGNPGTDLFGGRIQVNSGSFVRSGTFPPTFDVLLTLSTPAGSSIFYTDSFTLDTTTILENVR